ncbi:MAG TPA: gamma-glutamyltransferase [Candidatus Binataceae bacterium]|nr:gamma-glutamyltransferase [Candidatus Binataceae bacterium]
MRRRSSPSFNAFVSIFIALFVTSSSAIAAGSDTSARAQHEMVVAETAEASAAGVEILKEGGNAVDAAAASALATGVTHAASCGLGGGGFMLIYLASTGKFYALDYRERAPMKASATMYIRDGKPDESLARNGALAIGVPGEIAGIDAALRRYGTMKFQQVAVPAVRLAEDGFSLNPHLAHEIASMQDKLKLDPAMASVFLKPDGSVPKPGDLIFNKNLAATIKKLGDKPSENFYHGAVAEDLAEFIQAKGGIMTTDDFAAYEPIWREPLHRPYRGYEVYTIPPPSSGGVVLEMLGMLEPGHLGGLGVNTPPYLARIAEVMREGFIDREKYGDPAFVDVPIAELLSAKHIDQAREEALHHTMSPPPTAPHDHGTANLIAADAEGNVVVLTTTINTSFGSKLMEPKTGIILNDEMDDFSVAVGVPNAFRLQGAAANAIAPGKRPLSSISPTIVIKGGKPVLAVGGSGGPTIITGVLQVALDVIDFHLGPGVSVDLPRIHEQAMPETMLIEEKMSPKTVTALQQMGFQTHTLPMLGAVGALTIEAGNLRGAGDPRKGGMASGY